jgi:hypothetical protein
MKLNLAFAFLGLAATLAVAAEAPANTSSTEEVWISSLDVSRIEQGWGEGRGNR